MDVYTNNTFEADFPNKVSPNYDLIIEIISFKHWSKTPKRFLKFLLTKNVTDFKTFLQDLAIEFSAFLQRKFKDALKENKDSQPKCKIQLG